MTETNQEEVKAQAENSHAAATPHVDAVAKDKVNDLVRDALDRGYEKGKQEALAQVQMQANISQPYAAPGVAGQPSMAAATPVTANPTQPTPQVQGGQFAQPAGQMPSADDLQRMINDGVGAKVAELQKQQQQQMHDAQWAQTVNQFLPKVQAGAGKYPDFDKTVAPMELDKPQNRHIVYLTNLVDNTADVLHDLGTNPEKLALIHQLAATNPQYAIKKINDLSQSIKVNQGALQVSKANDPLSQLTPSTVTTADDGEPMNRTPSDWRKKSYLRG